MIWVGAEHQSWEWNDPIDANAQVAGNPIDQAKIWIKEDLNLLLK